MSLLVAAAAAAVGAFDHARHGRIDTSSGLAFGAAGAVGALPGTALNRVLPERVLLAAFAIVLLAAAAMLLRRRADLLARNGNSSAHAAAAGVGTGVLTGLLGVGGGFLIVPVLVLVLGLPVRIAVGTSLLPITLTSTAALAAHLASGGVDATIAVVFAAASIGGTLAGRRVASGVSPARLGQLLAYVLAAVALFVLAEIVVAG
jgi:uncharacterized protein